MNLDTKHNSSILASFIRIETPAPFSVNDVISLNESFDTRYAILLNLMLELNEDKLLRAHAIWLAGKLLEVQKENQGAIISQREAAAYKSLQALQTDCSEAKQDKLLKKVERLAKHSVVRETVAAIVPTPSGRYTFPSVSRIYALAHGYILCSKGLEKEAPLAQILTDIVTRIENA